MNEEADELDVTRLMGILRAYINETRQKHLLIQNKLTFDQLIACLDCIEDTEYAIKEYEKSEIGRYGYLSLFGLQQALYVQQDALGHLSLCLLNENIKLKDKYPEIARVRDIRNLTSGHPTKNWHKTFNQIVHTSMKKESYTLIMRHTAGHTSREEIKLLDLIDSQRSCVKKHLSNIIAKMKSNYNKHKERFKGKLLLNEINSSTDYLITKLHTGESSDETEMAIAGVNCKELISTLEKINKGIVERYESASAIESFAYLHNEISHALHKLDEFYKIKHHNYREIGVYATFIKIKFNELKEYLTEVDKQFNE